MKGLTLRTTATVILTAHEWELFSSYEKDGTPEEKARLVEATRALNEAASKALSCGDPREAGRIFRAAQREYEDMGADDSEPTWKFEAMMKKVYGDE